MFDGRAYLSMGKQHAKHTVQLCSLIGHIDDCSQHLSKDYVYAEFGCGKAKLSKTIQDNAGTNHLLIDMAGFKNTVCSCLSLW